jgi:hypothetical protein
MQEFAHNHSSSAHTIEQFQTAVTAAVRPGVRHRRPRAPRRTPAATAYARAPGGAPLHRPGAHEVAGGRSSFPGSRTLHLQTAGVIIGLGTE